MKKSINISIIIIFFIFINSASSYDKNNLSFIFNRIINNEIGKREIASSFLIEKGMPRDFYNPGKAFDKNKDTAWAIGAGKSSINEYIYFKIEIGLINDKFPKNVSMFIVNGLAKSNKLFKANNRVKKAILEIYECEYILGQYKNRLKQKPVFNSSVELNFEDSKNPQEFKIVINNKQKGVSNNPAFVYVGKLIIKEIYKGSKYNDTCISEIYFKTKFQI